jgi:uncharacterized protein YpmS
MKKVAGILLIFIFIISALGKQQAVQASNDFTYTINTGATKIDQTVQDSLNNLQSNEMLTVMVTCDSKLISRGYRREIARRVCMA